MNLMKIFIILLLTNLLIIPITRADPAVVIDSYELYPEVFMPGDSGMLKLTIKNAETTNTVQHTSTIGSDTTVRTDTVGAIINNIWITTVGDGSRQVKPTLSYINVGALAPGSSITIMFEIVVEENITKGLYFPSARIDVETYEDVRYPIPLRISNRTVDLLFTNLPSKISKSGSTLIELTVVNNRENTVDGITIVPESIDGLEFTPNSLYIGSLDADVSSTASFSIKPNAIGKKNLTFHVQFKNGDNEHTETYTSSLEIINTLDVGSVFTSIPRSIQKGRSSRITLEVYNAKTESITGVIVTPHANTTVLPSQYFIGSMEPDDVFSASFDIYTDTLAYGIHAIEFEVSFKQGSEYYKTPILTTPYSVVKNEGASYQSNKRVNEEPQGMPNLNILNVCLPFIIVIAVILGIVILFIWKKKRGDK